MAHRRKETLCGRFVGCNASQTNISQIFGICSLTINPTVTEHCFEVSRRSVHDRTSYGGN